MNKSSKDKKCSIKCKFTHLCERYTTEFKSDTELVLISDEDKFEYPGDCPEFYYNNYIENRQKQREKDESNKE